MSLWSLSWSEVGERYQPYYCEENVWHLVQSPALAAQRRRVAFISNENRAVAMWCQRAAARFGDPSEYLILWDYHVIALGWQAGRWHVWDLDTTLPNPSPAGAYLAASFRELGPRLARYAPQFRVIDADDYVRDLRSDRSHMRDERGELRQPAPPWPCIGGADAPPNLDAYIDIAAPHPGMTVPDLASLRRLLAID